MMLFIGSDDNGWSVFSFEQAPLTEGATEMTKTQRMVDVISGKNVPASAVVEWKDYVGMTLNEICDAIAGGDLEKIQTDFEIDEAGMFKTSPDQDAAALAKANEIVNSPGVYNLDARSCGIVSLAVAAAGGVYPRGIFVPNLMFEKNVSRFDYMGGTRAYRDVRQQRAHEKQGYQSSYTFDGRTLKTSNSHALTSFRVTWD